VKDKPELYGTSVDITLVPVRPQAIQAIIPDKQPALGGLGYTGTSSSDTSHARIHKHSNVDNTTFKVVMILSSM
jgi:hypothetical protein